MFSSTLLAMVTIALLGQSAAVVQRTWQGPTSACTGTTRNNAVWPDGVCFSFATHTSSRKYTCSSATAGATVTIEHWNSNTDCSGTPDFSDTAVSGQCDADAIETTMYRCDQSFYTGGANSQVAVSFSDPGTTCDPASGAQQAAATAGGTCNKRYSSDSYKFYCETETANSAWTAWRYNTGDCSGDPTLHTYGEGSSCAVDINRAINVDCATGSAANLPPITPTDDDGCFAASSTVLLEDGRRVAYSALQVGDQVLSVDATGRPFFDTVFRVTHHDTTTHTTFLKFTLVGGVEVVVTGNHFLHAGSCCDLSTLTAASDIAIGDDLFVVSTKSGTTPATVLNVESVEQVGAFNVHTLSGSLVVDSVASSHFSSATTWSAQARPWATYWYRVLHSLSW